MSLGIFAEIYSGMLNAFGSPALVMLLIAICVIALVSVTVKVNAFISIFLALIPFIVLMLYGAVAGQNYALGLSVVFIGCLLGISFYKIFNR